ncbi:MAG: TetR/AcrR family transcriptional regulator [Verrucomicrobiota bacterium]
MGRYESEQRKKILHSAVDIFAKEGWKGATIRRVGRAAGVNSALIYYYFENKHTLFMECIRMVLAGFLEHLRQQKRAFRGARERLACLVNGVFDYYTAYPHRMRLMLLAFSVHGDLLGQTLAGFLKSRVLTPLEILREGMQAGELREIHPVHAWWSIMGICLFNLQVKDIIPYMTLKSAPIPPFDPEERRAQIVDLLVHGWALPSSVEH